MTQAPGELKKRLRESEQRDATCRSHLERRTLLEEKLASLEDEIDAVTLRYHRYLSYRPAEAQRLTTRLDELKKQREQLAGELREIDLWLEREGDSHDEMLANIRAALIDAILELHPEAAAAYKEIVARQRKKEALLEQLDRFTKEFSAFYGHMKEGAATLESAKRRGLLDYVFGRNPKVILAGSIAAAAKEAEVLLRLLEPMRKEPLYYDFHPFLITFLEEAHKKWNSRLYNGGFQELYGQFDTLWKEIEEERSRIQSVLQECNAAIDALIDRYSATPE